MPARSNESTTASLASPCMFPRKRSSAMSTYAGPSMHVHLCCYCLFLCCVSAMSTYYDAPSMSSGASIHPPCSGNQGLLAPSNHRHMLEPHPSSFVFQPHPSSFVFQRVRRCQTAAALPTKWQPVGHESCWGSAVSHACSPATLAAVTCLWSGCGAHGAAQSRYVNPTNACHLTHPALFLAGSKVPNGALPTKWQPVGPESCWGSAVSHACAPVTLAAVTCLWSGWWPTVLPRAVTSTQPMPATPPIQLCF